MGKRKRERTEEELRNKIKKLQKKLAAKENSEAYTADAPQGDADYYDPSLDGVYQDSPAYSTPLPPPRGESPPPHAPSLSPNAQLPSPLQHNGSPLQRDSLHIPQPEPQPSTSGSVEKQDQELELDSEILELLSTAPEPESCLGPTIHRDVAKRWQDILQKGLAKEIKDKLLKTYLVPANCDLLLPPSLNLEVKAALSEPLVKRDYSLSNRQNQLGVALSALAQVTEMIITNETSKQKLLKPLSDACRLLCDSHYLETQTRRHFVITAINSKMKNTLVESRRDKFLFGDNVSDKLKAAKTIQQSGEALKNVPATKPRPRPVFSTTTSNRGRLNFGPQHRKTDNKPSDYRPRRPNNPPQRHHNTNTAGRASDRSAPAPPRTQTFHRR